MRSFQEKKKWRKVMESKPMLIFLGIVILVFAYSVFGLVGRVQETQKNKNIAVDKINQLQQERDKLTSDIQKLNTDEGKEEAIREKFGMAKDGEGLVVVTDDKNAPLPTTENKPNSFSSFFKNLFK